MKVLNRSQLLAIILTLTLFGGFLFAQLYQNTVLYTLDPWVQRFYSEYGESQSLFSQNTAIHSGELVLPYHTFLRTTTYLLAEGGGIDSFQLYQFGSVILRVVYALLIMMTVIAMTRRVQYALVTVLLMFTSSFFVFRSHVLIPQNVGVLFLLLMIWSLEKYNNSGRLVFLLGFILAILGNVFYEPTSIFISGIIIFSYTIKFLINEKLRHVEFMYFSVLICVILLLPMFDTLLQVVQSTFASFGNNSIWGQYAKGYDAPLLPVINNYFEIIGYPVMIFTMIGTVAIVWRNFRQAIHLLVMLVLMLLLTLTLSPQIGLSPGRMQDYIFIPMLLISAIYVSALFKRTGRLVRMLLIAILITMGLATMITTPPWFQLGTGVLDIAAVVDQELEENPDAIVYVEPDAMFISMILHNPDQICAYWDPIFQWYRPPASGDVPDCTKAEYRIRQSETPLQQYQIIQEAGDYRVYKLLPET